MTRSLHDLTAALREEEDKLLTCVHCGFCLPACPTYNRLGNEAESPRGRLHLMRSAVEGRADPADPDFRLHLDQCLGCRACEPVCPSGVRYGFLLERARAMTAAAAGIPLPTRLTLWTFRRRWTTTLAMALARALRGSGLPRLLLRLLPKSMGRTRFGLAMLAATSPGRGAAEAARRAAPADRESDDDAAAAPAARAGTATLLRGCVQDGLYRRVNAATREALRENGIDLVDAPGQGCCGALHAHAGDLEGARELARRNVAAFRECGAGAVVVNAAGCGAFMKEYGELLADDALAEDARAVAERVADVTEALAAAGPRSGAELRLRVAYDEACHLHHGQGVTRAPYDVLGAAPALERVRPEAADECCGGAGIYGLMHPELGGRILDDKLDRLLETRPDVIATANPGCMMQIGAGLLLRGVDVPVVHPVELLAESYRRTKAEEEPGG